MIRIAGLSRDQGFDGPPEPVRPDRLRPHHHHSIEIRRLIGISVVFVVLNDGNVTTGDGCAGDCKSLR